MGSFFYLLVRKTPSAVYRKKRGRKPLGWEVENMNQKIEELRRQGESYGFIAKALGISVNTVKSYCQRKGLRKPEVKLHDLCAHCGEVLTHTPGRKKKRFCDKKCRMAWWAKHPEALNKKAIYSFTCLTCKQRFQSYGNAKRKYCSRACYGSRHD